MVPNQPRLEPDRQGNHAETLRGHFGISEGLVPLWIAEPSVDLAPAVGDALQRRAQEGWYGYETRPPSLIEAFWQWMLSRHGWNGSDLLTSVSPSIGTSIGVLLEQLTEPGDGVIIQPPVFTDFKTLITSNNRTVVKNALQLTDHGYEIDFDDLDAKAADPTNRVLILCSPHNPVGRVWTSNELRKVASICADNAVFLLADEIHADLTIPPATFTPLATVARKTDGLRWAATHGPIKTFGLAGICDTLLVTDDAALSERFGSTSSRLHLTRNNVFGLAAFEAAYRTGAEWVDDLLALVARNVEILATTLPPEVELMRPEGTYLAWLDMRELQIGVPELPRWIASNAGLALSPGHWFGREGAGFARMTIAAPSPVVEQAAVDLARAVERMNTSDTD